MGADRETKINKNRKEKEGTALVPVWGSLRGEGSVL